MPGRFRSSHTVSAVLLFVIIALFVVLYSDLVIGKKIFVHDSIIWFGGFHYYLDSLINGNFPYWDPYTAGGGYFYPNIALHGLDPTYLAEALCVRFFGLSTVTAYIYLRFIRLALVFSGLYLLFNHVSKCRTGALLSAGVFIFSSVNSYFVQSGGIDNMFLTPLVLYSLLKFLDEPDSPRRYFYLSCITLLSGISMTIHIPAYYLFNLVFFCVAVIVFGDRPLPAVVRAYRDGRLVMFSAASVLLVLLMMAPSLMVLIKDASSKGELFPTVRIVQKNDGKFKKILASEVSNDALSDKYLDKRGVFASYGNFVNLIQPDIVKSIPFFADDLMAEIQEYMGIIPLLLAVIGFIYGKSFYRYVALLMAGLIAINMFSFAGMSSKPFNFLQKGFNMLFFPLQLMEARELLGSYCVLYLCMLLSMGLGIFFEENNLSAFLKARYKAILGICAAVLLTKTAITWYYAGKLLFASYYDLFVVLQIIAFAVLVYLHARGVLAKAVFLIALVTVIVADMFVYCKDGMDVVLQDSRFYYDIAEEGRKNSAGGGFQYFKEPLPSPLNFAFGETVFKSKGVLTYGNNHIIFTTKRYYDLLTHVPLETQMALSGVVFPVVRFFTADQVRHTADRRQALEYLSHANIGDVASSLLIEDRNGKSAAGPLELKRLGEYEDVSALYISNLYPFAEQYRNRYAGLLLDTRKHLSEFLHTPEFSLEVQDFSPNSISIRVANLLPGYLQYNDGWSRYWQAFDNGRETPVYIANYNSKAVFLDKGEHFVRFVFNPVHYKAGLFAYYTGLLISAGLTAFLFVRNRKRTGILPGSQDCGLN